MPFRLRSTNPFPASGCTGRPPPACYGRSAVSHRCLPTVRKRKHFYGGNSPNRYAVRQSPRTSSCSWLNVNRSPTNRVAMSGDSILPRSRFMAYSTMVRWSNASSGRWLTGNHFDVVPPGEVDSSIGLAHQAQYTMDTIGRPPCERAGSPNVKAAQDIWMQRRRRFQWRQRRLFQ